MLLEVPSEVPHICFELPAWPAPLVVFAWPALFVPFPLFAGWVFWSFGPLLTLSFVFGLSDLWFAALLLFELFVLYSLSSAGFFLLLFPLKLDLEFIVPLIWLI